MHLFVLFLSFLLNVVSVVLLLLLFFFICSRGGLDMGAMAHGAISLP